MYSGCTIRNTRSVNGWIVKTLGLLLITSLLLTGPGVAKASETSTFSDISGHKYEALIEQAAEDGWVNGCPDGRFWPDRPITRWEYAKMMLAAPYCKTIISAFHALVYDSKSVFEYTVRDKDDDKRIIADWDDLNNTNYHHNNTLANGSTELKSNRTLLGHKANGAFVLVCTWCGMDLRVAAKMMADLGCDYAVNMDGSSAIRMRVASGYTNGVKDPGQVCGNNNTKQDYYGTASCVYLT